MNLWNKIKVKFTMGLQGKITIFFILGIIVSVSLLSYSYLTTMRSTLEKEIQKEQMMIADAFEAQVEQYFNDAMGVVRMTAQLPAVQDVSSIGFIREDIKGVPQEVDRPKRDVINYVLKHYGQFGYMEQVTGDVGNNIVIEPWNYQLDLKRLDFGFRDWFKQAVTKRNTHISEVYVSSSLQKPVIAISHPIINDQGEIDAVWMGALTLEKLSELCSTLTIGKTGYVYLVDQKGVLAAYQNFDIIKELRDLSKTPAVQRIMKGESGTALLTDPFEKKEFLTSYKPVGKTGWGIIVVQDPAEAFAPIQTTMTRAIKVSVILVILSLFAALLLARSISRPISRLASAAVKVAEGDLTTNISIHSNDEIGKLAGAFSQMVSQMRQIVVEIMNKANTVTSSSQVLNSSATETSASATETSATMTEISSVVDHVNANIQEVSTLTQTATEQASEGSKGISRIIEQMQAITSKAVVVSDSIDGLNKKSHEINKIVELITSIADQTNLLALNAAIEAARAGEQGRGFAVVAEEVRKLAEQSASAAKEIYTLIHAIQHESQKAVVNMEESGKEVAAGTRVVGEVGENFKEIIGSVQELSLEVKEVASAVEQMSGGVQNVAAATEEQTAIMEEVSASAESLSHLSEELNALIGRFKV